MRHEPDQPGSRHVQGESEDENREPIHLAGWIWFLVLIFAGVLFTPLFFGASGSRPLLMMGLAAGIAAVLVAGAGACAYFFAGTNRAVNLVVAITILLAAGGLFLRGRDLGLDARAAREEAALTALREAQVAYRHAVTYSGSGWWEMSGPTAADAFKEPLARFPDTAVSQIVSHAMTVVRELEASEQKYRESVKAFHDAGGLTASTLKTKALCGIRIELLRDMARASAAEMELLDHFADRIRSRVESVDASADLREASIGVLASGPQLAAAGNIHRLDRDYTERAIRYIEFLRVNSGKWTITSQDNTIYLGYDVSRDEFANLQRQVNEIADRQLAIQRVALEVPEQKFASGRGRGTDLTGSSKAKPAEKQTEAGVR